MELVVGEKAVFASCLFGAVQKKEIAYRGAFVTLHLFFFFFFLFVDFVDSELVLEAMKQVSKASPGFLYSF